MLGVLVLVIVSWLILWFFSKEHITVLGVIPDGERLKAFSVGLLVMAFFCTINVIGQAYFRDVEYIRNPDYGLWESINGMCWTFKAALFEELIFRGAILYLLIKRVGVKWACILSAIAFGVYHWFSYEMFGRGIVSMTYVFLLTGASGYMFAYAFAKTKSMYAPLGLHFGWIVVSIVVFSDGPLGDSLFLMDGENVDVGGWEQLLVFLWQAAIIPILITWYLMRRFKPSEDKYIQ